MKPIIFVFGSNEAGRHGAGAAKDAMLNYGAQWGVGKGLCGQSYAIPTKDKSIKTLSLNEIRKHVYDFLLFTEDRLDLAFFVTPIGCGLAGYSHYEIAPMFRRAGDNVSLPASFAQVLMLERDKAKLLELKTRDAVEQLDLQDLRELLDAWDPEWMYHYNNDEMIALDVAFQYGMPDFATVVEEFSA